MIFKASINQLIQVTDPAARAIVCLESPHSSAADVFVFVAGALLLTRKNIETMMKSSLPLDLPKDAIFEILTKRFNQLINSKNGHDVYFTATLLHPGTFRLSQNYSRPLKASTMKSM